MYYFEKVEIGDHTIHVVLDHDQEKVMLHAVGQYPNGDPLHEVDLVFPVHSGPLLDWDHRHIAVLDGRSIEGAGDLDGPAVELRFGNGAWARVPTGSWEAAIAYHQKALGDPVRRARWRDAMEKKEQEAEAEFRQLLGDIAKGEHDA